MLERITSPKGVVYYRSPLLHARGVPHAFSTRIGGISPPPFDSLNLGNPSGCEIQDDYDRIWENYRILQSAIGCEGRELCRLHQVHARHIVRVEKSEPHENATKGDALVSDDPKRILSVRIADCVPVLIADETGATVAAVHAGWRGVVAGIVPAAVRLMAGADPGRAKHFAVAVGPAIGFDAFEVGEEVLDAFAAEFKNEPPIRRRADGKGYVDLREAIRRQLAECGVVPDHIDTTDRCTFRDRDEFFSHRRDRGVSGRMAAIVGARNFFC